MKNRLFIFLVLLGLPQWLLAQDIPDFSANYQVKVNGLAAGELKRDLSTDEKGVRTFKSESQAKGVFAFFKPDLVQETSVWSWQDNIVTPHSYLYERTGGKKEKYLNIIFNWETNQIEVNDKKQPLILENIETETLDKLLYQIALMSDLAKGETDLSYIVADGAKLKTYDITILGNEIIDTPLGKIETVKLTRQRGERTTTLWCAPTLYYLPVRLEHSEKGNTGFSAELRRLKGIPTDNAFEPAINKTAITTP